MSLTFGTVNGFYLCAEDEGRSPLVANRRSADAWETFDVTLVGPDRVALTAVNGKYVCAEGGGGRELIANRTAIGPWETFVVVPAGDGVALQAANGLFVCAEGGGGNGVIANRPRIGSWETFTPSESVIVPAPTSPLVGQLQVMGYSYADDTGPRKVQFCSWFPALRIWRDDRQAAIAELDRIARAGWQGIRVFTAVGGWSPFWDGREVAPVRFRKWLDWDRESDRDVDEWSDYDTILEGFLRACADRKLKLHLTTGDLQILMPRPHQRMAHAERVAEIVNRVGPDVVGLYEVCNESFQNGIPEPNDARVLADHFHYFCSAPLRALSTPYSGEEPDGLYAWSDGVDVCAIHGARDVGNAAERAFSLVYWAGDVHHFPKPFWQGEPTGPNGSGPEVFAPVNDPRDLFAIYAVHLMTGQASNFFNGPAVRYREPLGVTWGFRELPKLLSVMPDDIGQWPHVSHGNKASTPISAQRFADTGSGPARVDQVWNDRQVIAIAHSGIGPWDLVLRRNLAWKLYSANGLEDEGRGQSLPPLDASMRSRLIVGEFM